MRKILYFVLCLSIVFTSVIFTSCGENTTDNKDNLESIIESELSTEKSKPKGVKVIDSTGFVDGYAGVFYSSIAEGYEFGKKDLAIINKNGDVVFNTFNGIETPNGTLMYFFAEFEGESNSGRSTNSNSIQDLFCNSGEYFVIHASNKDTQTEHYLLMDYNKKVYESVKIDHYYEVYSLGGGSFRIGYGGQDYEDETIIYWSGTKGGEYNLPGETKELINGYFLTKSTEEDFYKNSTTYTIYDNKSEIAKNQFSQEELVEIWDRDIVDDNFGVFHYIDSYVNEGKSFYYFNLLTGSSWNYDSSAVILSNKFNNEKFILLSYYSLNDKYFKICKFDTDGKETEVYSKTNVMMCPIGAEVNDENNFVYYSGNGAFNYDNLSGVVVKNFEDWELNKYELEFINFEDNKVYKLNTDFPDHNEIELASINSKYIGVGLIGADNKSYVSFLDHQCKKVSEPENDYGNHYKKGKVIIFNDNVYSTTSTFSKSSIILDANEDIIHTENGEYYTLDNKLLFTPSNLSK